jgi:hypothetical protein
MSPAVTAKGIRYRCDLCDEWFDTVHEEIEHLKHTHYGPARFGFECEICHPKK